MLYYMLCTHRYIRSVFTYVNTSFVHKMHSPLHSFGISCGNTSFVHFVYSSLQLFYFFDRQAGKVSYKIDRHIF